MDIKVVFEMLGHSGTAITQIRYMVKSTICVNGRPTGRSGPSSGARWFSLWRRSAKVFIFGVCGADFLISVSTEAARTLRRAGAPVSRRCSTRRTAPTHFAKTRGKQNELLDLACAANFAEELWVFQAGLDDAGTPCLDP